MTALAADRNTRRKFHERTLSIPVAASTLIYQGAMVAVNTAGYAVPAAKTAGLVVKGRADSQVDNSSGANGDLEVRVSTGVFEWENDADAVAQADCGRPVYVVDDNTVADENEGSQIVAGVLDSLDAKTGKPWVRTLDLADPGAIGGIETVSAAGPLSLYTRTSLIDITGTMALTLADGLFEGQRKSVTVIAAGSTPAATLTPSTYADGTSEHLAAIGDRLELEWHETGGWRRIAFGDMADASVVETVAAGAISLFTRTSLITVDGTKAYTLADGLFEGQRKTLLCTSAVNTPIGTVTPASYSGRTSDKFYNAGEFLELEWHAGGWVLLDQRLSLGASETVASGAISVYTRLTIMTTSGAQAYTLADGLFVGQRKTIRCGTTDNTGTITPASPVGYATLALDAVQEFVELHWNGAAWELLSSLCTIA